MQLTWPSGCSRTGLRPVAMCFFHHAAGRGESAQCGSDFLQACFSFRYVRHFGLARRRVRLGNTVQEPHRDLLARGYRFPDGLVTGVIFGDWRLRLTLPSVAGSSGGGLPNGVPAQSSGRFLLSALRKSRRGRARFRGQADAARSVFEHHDFGRFDDSSHAVTLRKLHLLRAAPRDDALDQILAHTNRDTSHHVAQVDVLNRSGKLVSSGKPHLKIVPSGICPVPGPQIMPGESSSFILPEVQQQGVVQVEADSSRLKSHEWRGVH